MIKKISILLVVILMTFISLHAQEPQVREFYNKGTEESKKGNWDLAIQFFTKAIELDSDFSSAFSSRGLAYMRKRSTNPNIQKQIYESAVYDLTKAIELNPNSAGGYINRSGIYSITKEFDKALEDLKKAEDIDPKLPYIFAARGSVYQRMNNFPMAINSFTKAIELKNLSTFYTNRCVANYAFEKYESSVSDCSEAIAKNSKDSMAFYYRGIARIKLEQTALATTDLRNALDINPNFTLAKNQLDILLKNNKY